MKYKIASTQKVKQWDPHDDAGQLCVLAFTDISEVGINFPVDLMKFALKHKITPDFCKAIYAEVVRKITNLLSVLDNQPELLRFLKSKIKKCKQKDIESAIAGVKMLLDVSGENISTKESLETILKNLEKKRSDILTKKARRHGGV